MADGEARWWTDPRPGRILRGARAVEGGVELRSPPRWFNATAVISPTGLILVHRATSVVLRWTDPDWGFALWGSSSSTTDGVAVDDHRAASELRGSWVWPLRTFSGRRRHLIPIEAMRTEAAVASGRVRLLETMRTLLGDRPDACNRLNDPVRCERLAHDLRTWNPDLVPPGPHPKARRALPVQAAVARAGYHHEGGHPLPGWVAPPVDQIIEEVRRRLAGAPGTRSLEITDEEIRQVVVRAYLGVPSWPFAALLFD